MVLPKKVPLPASIYQGADKTKIAKTGQSNLFERPCEVPHPQNYPSVRLLLVDIVLPK